MKLFMKARHFLRFVGYITGHAKLRRRASERLGNTPAL